MSPSPIEQLIDALDRADLDGAIGLFAPNARVLCADGRRAEGHEAIRGLITEFLEPIRSMTHRVTAEWHPDEVWIAEVEADYELRDYLQLTALPRAFIVRQGPDGIDEMRVYGAHEHPLADHRSGEEGVWVGGRLIPPL